MGSISSKVLSFGFSKSQAVQLEQRISELSELGVQMVDSLIKKLKSAPDLDTFRDYWLEGTYSRVFTVNNLPVELEPYGNKGPDMLIKISEHHIYVEVKHFRSVYWQSKSPIKAVAGAIRDKLRQTLDNEINIVIVDSGRITISKSSFYKGIYLCRDLCQKSSLSAKKLTNLSCIIMRLSFFDSKSNKPFYWRFLRTSMKKVPSEVKRRMSEILEEQIAIEHQKIIKMLTD